MEEDKDNHPNKKRKTEKSCVPIVLDPETRVKSDFLLHLPVAAQIKYQRLDKYFIGLTAEEVYKNRFKVSELLEPIDRVLWEILLGNISYGGSWSHLFFIFTI